MCRAEGLQNALQAGDARCLGSRHQDVVAHRCFDFEGARILAATDRGAYQQAPACTRSHRHGVFRLATRRHHAARATSPPPVHPCDDPSRLDRRR
jgi:hypothetical protein